MLMASSRNSVLVCSQWYLAGQKYPSPFITDIPTVVLFFNVSWKNQPFRCFEKGIPAIEPSLRKTGASAPTAAPALQALLVFCLLACFVVNWSCCVLQASLELSILPPLPFQFRDYRHVPPHLAS